MTREQLLGLIILLGTLSVYLLWTLLSLGTFLPYQGETQNAPAVGNIALFIALLAIAASAILTNLVIGINFVLVKLLKKGTYLGVGFIAGVFTLLFLFLYVSIALHISMLFPFPLSWLFFCLFWGIVLYAKRKKKHHLERFASSTTTATGKHA